jgi:hypothetical protein
MHFIRQVQRGSINGNGTSRVPSFIAAREHDNRFSLQKVTVFCPENMYSVPDFNRESAHIPSLASASPYILHGEVCLSRDLLN